MKTAEISHIYGVWEVQDQGINIFDVWQGPTSKFIDSYLFTVSSYDRRGKGTLWGLF